MTPTMINNGQRVWAAVKELSGELAPNQWFNFTVGEVAEKAKMSKATVRKYLEMAWEDGYITKMTSKGKTVAYTVDGQEK